MLPDRGLNASDVRTLAQAVLARAFWDAFERGANPRERREAKLFLTIRHGEWAQSFDDWCLLADLDPSAVRRRVAQVESRNERGVRL
jgi:hypothetical protein